MFKLKVNSFLAATFVALILSSCEELLQELTTKEIPVENLEIDFDAVVNSEDAITVQASSLRSNAADFFPFEGKDTLRQSNISEYEIYAALVKKVSLSEVKVSVATTDDEGTSVKELKLQSNTLNKSCEIEEYQFNEPYTADEDLSDLLSSAIAALFAKENDAAESVDFDLSGKTDAKQGSKITLKLTLNGFMTVQIAVNKNEPE
ncbi:MAG: hypothetical protein LBJ17_02355 [Dysgonamonadaceae bacterium]|jgi:hypothetical protein|nr:hypothetical protein [Dysgonamonadaceae bacterium]